jgi:hypothetical protein
VEQPHFVNPRGLARRQSGRSPSTDREVPFRAPKGTYPLKTSTHKIVYIGSAVTGHLFWLRDIIPALISMPISFPSHKELRKHTRRHWQEFGLASEYALTEYLTLARDFCDGLCPVGVEECERTCDNKIDRFCEVTARFAIFMPDRSAIITFHILHPAGTHGVPVERTHSFSTNRQYYEADCECLT